MELITGNKFKKNCNYSLDESGLKMIRKPDKTEIVKFFVKIDYVHNFFKTKQSEPYILVTHNGDLPVGDEYLIYMDDKNLISWYGQNINTNHPKLQSIPIGIANEIWDHGNEEVFFKVINSNIKKEKLIYVNFDVKTNINERTFCLSELQKKGLFMEKKLPFNEYLIEMASSYFVVSPNGNGIDCHKTWEGLYVKTIPIVTESINIDYYKNYPIVVLKDWDHFDLTYFTKDRYDKIWNNFNPKDLNIKNFISV